MKSVQDYKDIKLMKRKIWNDAVIATLREVNKYDGILSKSSREYLSASVFTKLKKGNISHEFKINY